MFNVEVGASKSICWSADEVANLIYKTTGLWKISKHLREVCPNMKVGDVEKLDDAGITIECIV